MLENAVVVDLHWRNDLGSLQVGKLSVAKYLLRTKQILRLQFWFSQGLLGDHGSLHKLCCRAADKVPPLQGCVATHRGIPVVLSRTLDRRFLRGEHIF